MSEQQTTGKIIGINGNLIAVQFDGVVRQNEVGFIHASEGETLKAEVIRIHGQTADLQVFESTEGLKVNNTVEFTGEMLAVELGPGLLTSVYDGLQNPLPQLAEAAGFFLKRGLYLKGLDREKKWTWTAKVAVGDVVQAGDTLGTVPEGRFDHQIKVPFLLRGSFTVSDVTAAGDYTVEEVMVKAKDENGNEREFTMMQQWPVKLANKYYKERLAPTEPMITGQRIIDTFFPVNKGGTYCIPGPFGAGKTVMQQITSRYADVDVVIIAACGERAGEVVETLREFPELDDPRTGRSLMERTVIICNTSSMPVAAREASVYTAVSLGEYYRSMGLDVLLLADSTSRWAQALREMSGRLEEIPGEEAFPAYLESRIAEFYERAGRVENNDGSIGSLTVGGSVSPAGGNFNEPVTQGTLKVVKAFHGLSRARADARRFPSVDPLDSWSKSDGIMDTELVEEARKLLKRGNDVKQMMTVVGQEGISSDEFAIYQKSEILDRVYLQQNAFDEVDASCPADRQKDVFSTMISFLRKDFDLKDKNEIRDHFLGLQETMLRWNKAKMESEDYSKLKSEIQAALS